MGGKILITGGTGFIGKHLIEEIVNSTKNRIIIVSRGSKKKLYKTDRIKYFEFDITSGKIPNHIIEGSDSVIHLASAMKAQKITDISQLVKTNVFGTSLVVESAAVNNVKRFIFFSTSGVYQDPHFDSKINEFYPTNPVNLYTATKLAAEKIIQTVNRDFGLPTVIVRPTNVYGPDQDKNWMVPLFISKLKKNQSIYLNHMGRPKRDWLYIDDLTQALITILKAPVDKVDGQIFNIGIGKSITNLSVAQKIAEKLGKKKNLIKLLPSGPHENMNNYSTPDKIFKLLGWSAKVSFDQGLERTLKWYDKKQE